MRAAPPLPPPSRRHGDVQPADDAEALALAVLHLHEHLLEAATVRATTDFRPVTTSTQHTAPRRVDATLGSDPVPLSLETSLAPTLTRRLSQVLPRLRRRLARTRKELPLGRLREQDAACLRHNARRPGITLIEKAGPRQTLRGVVRQARFDTVENRVLKRGAERLTRRARQTLRGAPATGSPRSRLLRRLGATARLALDHPELAEVRRPRPGDRPTNALLHDADYRAVWRYLRRLDESEQAFETAWQALGLAWRDAAVFTLWALIDADPRWSAQPTRLDGLAERDDERPDRVPTRRWWRADEHALTQLDVTPTPEGLSISQHHTPSGHTTECHWRVHLPWDAPEEAPGDTTVCPATGTTSWLRLREHLVERILTAAADAGLDLTPDAPQPAMTADRVSLDATGLHVRRTAGDTTALHGAVAFAEIPPPPLGDPDASVWAHGGPATWLPTVTGPAEAWTVDHLDRLAERLATLRGSRATAVVVPDLADEHQLAILQSHMPGVWTVWHPVACALAAMADGRLDVQPGQDASLVVVTAVAALTEVTVLDLEWLERDGHLEPRWIRAWPDRVDAAGALDGLDASDVMARLRSPEPTMRWIQGETGWRPGARSPLPRRDLSAAVARTLASHGVASPLAILTVGAVDRGSLDGLTAAPVIEAPADLACRGAAVFLERHAAGLPTWADRRPDVGLTARVGRTEQVVPLFDEETQLVEPGQRIRERSRVKMILDPGQPRFFWAVQRRGRTAAYQLLAEHGPLPLGRRTEVRVHVDFVYGSDAIRVALVPEGAAAFTRLPLTLVTAGEAVTRQRQEGPPPRPPIRAVPDEATVSRWAQQMTTIVSVLGASRKGGGKKRKGSGSPNNATDLVRSLDRDVRDGLKTTHPNHLPASIRRALADQVVTPLEGVLGVRKVKKLWAPTLKDQSLLQALWRLRAALRIRIDGEPLVPSAGLQADLRLLLLAVTLDGRPDGQLDMLLATEGRGLHDESSWCRGLSEAIRADVSLAQAMSPQQAAAAWHRLLCFLEALAEVDRPEKRKADFARAFQLVVLLLQARAAGMFPVDGEDVSAMRTRLKALQDHLPDSVIAHRETGDASDDPPLQHALRCLDGVYVATARGGQP